MAEERTITQRLFAALVDRGLVTSDQISHAQELHLKTRQPLGEVLVARGLVTPADVRGVLEDDLGVPHLDLASYAPEPSALRLVPAEVARANRILPLFEIEGMLTVAVANPMDVFSFDELSAQLAYDLEPVLSDPSAITEAVQAHYGSVVPTESPPAEAGFAQAAPPEAAPPEAAPPEAAPAEAAPAEAAPAEAAPVAAGAKSAPALAAAGTIDLDVLAVADPTAAVLLVTDIVTAARDAGASHVHIDPAGPEFELRFHIGDERRFIAKAAVSFEGSLSRTIRAMAHISAEQGHPATGRMRLFVRDEEISIGVSFIPTVGGERLVMSLPNGPGCPGSLAEAGLEEDDLAALKGLLSAGAGLLLVAGPVRSGRSTTMELILAHLASLNRTVLAIQEYVAREIEGVWQVELSPGTGLAAAAATAAALRQDVDVLALDELRHTEEAHLLLQASASGRLVLATVIGADGGDVIGRLVSMGVEPQSLAAQLVGVLSQRVLAANCGACREEYDSGLLGHLSEGTRARPMRGAGCEACGGTGLSGTTAIFELMPMSDVLTHALAEGATRDELREIAVRQGIRTLLANGLSRVDAGVVTLEELDRALPFARD